MSDAPEVGPIFAFAPATADRATQESLHRLYNSVELEGWPEDPPTTFDDFIHGYIDPPPWAVLHNWAARDDAGELAGFAQLTWSTRPENPHLAHFTIAVDAPYRRRGLGHAFLQIVAETSAAAGRTLLATQAVDDLPGAAFLGSIGAECRLTNRKSSLLVERVDRSLMESWVARARERAVGWSLVGWRGACPDEHLEAFVELEHVMNTAPRGIDMEDWRQTTEMYREREEHYLEQGYDHWVLVARREADGVLAGFTELMWLPQDKTIAWQGGTGVHPDHRNLGLGRWLKAAMVLQMFDERPETTRIDTFNAFVNEPMLNINIAMGFELVRAASEWQIPVDEALAAAG